ncbi:stage V sporulation protein AF [Paenibacillus sp. UNC496MF]|uniref:spore germination protein n=1 Tax=Paenibacillus sp. UNC496MF TaxID=1502753 RepID=UPI0008E98770|nr:spore germination protein [Paenibacillus sp. UNC496MF]SFI56930.1 stage V sporulation protein AF [Paenibacillus sp. UNC496MF]
MRDNGHGDRETGTTEFKKPVHVFWHDDGNGFGDEPKEHGAGAVPADRAAVPADRAAIAAGGGRDREEAPPRKAERAPEHDKPGSDAPIGRADAAVKAEGGLRRADHQGEWFAEDEPDETPRSASSMDADEVSGQRVAAQENAEESLPVRRVAERPDAGELAGEPPGEPIAAHRKPGREAKGAKETDAKKDPVPIPASLDGFKRKLEEEVGYKTSFDIVLREMTFGDRRVAFFFFNGFAKDTILTEVLKRLTYLQAEDYRAASFHDFFRLYVPAIQVVEEQDWDNMMTDVLSGGTAMFVEGDDKVLLIDAKAFPSRNPEEPTLERVVRGARDGFVETMLVNVTLVRRRLRDKQLRYEILRVGERTQTDICIAYIDDIVDKEMLESMKDKIKQVKVDGLPLADKQLEEATVQRGWNPFPLVRYSERPDTVAVHLMEGNIAIFVDTTPSVMILPTTFFDLLQHAEENRQTPFIGTYLRWVRFFGVIASLFLLPLWFLFTLRPELKPPGLGFIGAQQAGHLPMVAQFILAEVGVDLMRMAAIHTPTPLATAMSLIAAILIGDIAVKTGLFVNEVVLYMAISAIGMFATPSYELGLANRIIRLVLIIAVALFEVPGFVVATTFFFVMLCMQRSFNRPYMWPLVPFDAKGMLGILLRVPVLQNRKRPNYLKAQQRDKMPN